MKFVFSSEAGSDVTHYYVGKIYRKQEANRDSVPMCVKHKSVALLPVIVLSLSLYPFDSQLI